MKSNKIKLYKSQSAFYMQVHMQTLPEAEHKN